MCSNINLEIEIEGANREGESSKTVRVGNDLTEKAQRIVTTTLVISLLISITTSAKSIRYRLSIEIFIQLEVSNLAHDVLEITTKAIFSTK